MRGDWTMFQRAMVIGSPGSGKSTFARRLRDLTGLPLVYLDQMWHRADGSHVSREAFDTALQAVLQQDRWIIDGNYQRTIPVRLPRADIVFLLDYPVEVCLAGALSRIGKPLEDLPWLEAEVDESFLQDIRAFPITQLPEIRAHLAKYPDKEVVCFHSREEADGWLRELERKR